jgi:hypothetical protein
MMPPRPWDCRRARKGIDLARDAVVEARTERDDDVRLLHREVRVRGTVHAEHVQTLQVRLVKHTEALQRRADGDVALLCELREEIRATRAGEDAGAGVDDGALRLVDECGSGLEDEGQVCWRYSVCLRETRGEGALTPTVGVSVLSVHKLKQCIPESI